MGFCLRKHNSDPLQQAKAQSLHAFGSEFVFLYRHFSVDSHLVFFESFRAGIVTKASGVIQASIAVPA
jgi:hypothetical protein